MLFEWDEHKNQANQVKHGISFEAVKLAFADSHQLTRFDRTEAGEDRYHTIACAGGVVVVLIVHAYRESTEGAEVIRIISARKANAVERRLYHGEQSSKR